MSKVLKPVIRIAAPIAGAALGSIVPGVGTMLGAALGGALGGYGGTRLTGGSGSESLLAGATGGLGGFAGAGGLSNILGSAGSAASNVIGTAAGTPLSTVTGQAGLQGATQGTGALGGITRGLSNIGLSNLSSTFGNSAGGSMFGGTPLSSIMGGYLQNRGAEKQKDAIIEQLARAQAEYAPYKESGLAANKRLTEMLGSGELGGRYGADDFEADPGYQFRLGEGSRLLNQRLAAGGNFFSGDALRAAQDYGQQAASQEYQNAFNRNLSEEQQIYNMLYGQQGVGANAARNLDDLYRQEAATRSGAYAAKTDALSRMLGGF